MGRTPSAEFLALVVGCDGGGPTVLRLYVASTGPDREQGVINVYLR